MKKLVSLILSITLLATSIIGAFAEKKPLESINMDNATINILENNNDYRLVESIKDGEVVTYKFDKNNNQLTIANQKTKESVIVNLKQNLAKNKFNNDTISEKKIQDDFLASSRVVSYQNTWSNFEYTRYSDSKFQLRRPNPDKPVTHTLYFDMYDDEESYTIVRDYKSVVNRINSKEGECIAYSSVTTLASCLTAFLAGFTGGVGGVVAGGIFSSLGLTGLTLTKYCELGNLCDEAIELYWDAYAYK